MEPFIEHTGIAAPLEASNVDTDQIIPARFCVGFTKTGYEDALLHDWREDPDFVLNNENYRGASILIAGEDFGTGSSREMAVWALANYGFRAIIAPRFGDIFRGNCLKNGLLTVELNQQVIDSLWARTREHPREPLTIDLANKQVRTTNAIHPFEFDDHAQWRLLNGHDDISLTLRHLDDIDQYEARRRRSLPIARATERTVHSG